MRTALWRRSAAVAGAALLLAPAAACGDSSSSGSSSSENVTLTVNLFGDFGYQDLYAKYSQEHPNITVKENVTDYGTHHKNLQAHLIANSGTADIEAIEIGQVAGFTGMAGKLVDFNTQGVDNRANGLNRRWRFGPSTDGKQLFGVSTDMGGLGLCYRADMFAKAGLPTKPRRRQQADQQLGRLLHGRQPVPREVPGQERQVVRLGQQRLQRDPRPGAAGLVRRERQGHRRLQPGP